MHRNMVKLIMKKQQKFLGKNILNGQSRLQVHVIENIIVSFNDIVFFRRRILEKQVIKNDQSCPSECHHRNMCMFVS